MMLQPMATCGNVAPNEGGKSAMAVRMRVEADLKSPKSKIVACAGRSLHEG